MTLTAPDLTMLGRELAGGLRRRGFGSQLISPADGRYEGARRVWNGTVDRHPALVARCATPRDVGLAIAAAREHELPLAVRSGGHSIPGHSACDGGIVVDLSAMRRVDVDPIARRFRVGGGALLEDISRAGQDYGLVVPSGHVSHTGIGGIATGGGIGWFHRQYGLIIDNLVSAQVVTADGDVVEADAETNPDLFWGIRGGGGNFGVVTEFRFRGHELGPTVFGGLMAFGLERAADAIHTGRALLEQHPELMIWEILTTAPPIPEFPADVQGRHVVLIAITWTGDLEAGRRATEPLRRLGPVVDGAGPMPFLAIQFLADDPAMPGLPNYARSLWMREFGEAPVEALIEAVTQVTSPLGAVICGRMGGAVADVPADATAFAHRGAHSVVWTTNAWMGGDPDAHRDWVRRTVAAAEPWSAGGIYVNAISEDEGEARVHDAYPRETWERLVAVKDRWDPENVFRLNQNVPPTGWTA